MQRGAAKAIAGLLLGAAYWQSVVLTTGSAEPWHSPSFLLTYAISIGLAGLLGFFSPKSSWLWGFTITLAQLPVMIVNSGVGPLMLVGLFFLFFLAGPPTGISTVMGALRMMISGRKN